MNQNLPESLSGLIRHFGGVVVREKKIVLTVLGVVVAVVAAVTFSIPRTYRSEGKLLLRLGRENASLDPTTSLGQESMVAVPNSRENEINSVVEVLQGRTLLEKVAEAVGPATILGKDPGTSTRDQAVRTLAQNLKVAPIRKTNLVQLSYQARSPEAAQKVLAAVIDLFQEEHIRLNRPPEIHDFFVKQTARLKDDLTQKESQLLDLKSSTGIASVSDQRVAIVKRLNRLQDDLLETEAARAAAASKIETLRKQLATLPEMRTSSQTNGVGNEGTDRMRDQFYALQLKKEEAAAKYTAEHPVMQHLEEQLAACRAILDRQAVTRTQTTMTVNRQYEDTQKALLEEEPVLVAMQTKAATLRMQIADVRGELKVFGRDELEIAQLEREVDTMQTSYRKYVANLEQTCVDRALEAQRMSNISVAETAALDPRPVSPQRSTSLALGLLVGLFGGLGAAVAKDQLGRTPPRPHAESPKPAHAAEPKPAYTVVETIPYVVARQPVMVEPRKWL
jgi:uncharacterized protein involved in exopolysaccharide biosynthesis